VNEYLSGVVVCGLVEIGDGLFLVSILLEKLSDLLRELRTLVINELRKASVLPSQLD